MVALLLQGPPFVGIACAKSRNVLRLHESNFCAEDRGMLSLPVPQRYPSQPSLSAASQAHGIPSCSRERQNIALASFANVTGKAQNPPLPILSLRGGIFFTLCCTFRCHFEARGSAVGARTGWDVATIKESIGHLVSALMMLRPSFVG